MPKHLPELRFYCRVLTPMFLFGINNKPINSQVELREESIIGLLRYWYRAIEPQQDVNQLKETESALFGGADQRGAFDILIMPTVQERIDTPTYTVSKQKLIPGKEGSGNTELNAINPTLPNAGSAFSVSLTFRRDYERYQEKVEALMVVASYLGGLGRRSRRGMGSIQLTKIERLTTIEQRVPVGAFEDDAAFLSHLSTQLNRIAPGNYKFNLHQWIIERVKTEEADKSGDKYHYPTIKRISLGAASSSFEDVLRKIYQATHDLSSQGSIYGEAMGRVSKRYASPMYTTVVEIDGKLHPLITELSSCFADSNLIRNEYQEKLQEKL